MRETAQITAEDIVFGIILCSLEVIPRSDGLFAVVVFGLVGVEVDFSEESASTY